MSKVFCCIVFLSFLNVHNASACEKDDNSGKSEDMIELSEPERTVAGAYYGMGFGLSRIATNSHLQSADFSETFKNCLLQYEMSLIAGFGGAFYEKYYAGIELGLCKNLLNKSKKSEVNDKYLDVIYKSDFSFNMDVRLGRQFPQNAALVYLSVGFMRAGGDLKLRNKEQASIGGFSWGSFYPTIGAGVEYKMNHNWNIRSDFKFAITSKDSKKTISNTGYSATVKPSRCCFRIALTRNI